MVSPAERRERRNGGVTVDLERVIDEIHDPVVGHAGARIEARLVPPVEGEAGIGDLDHEEGVCRVSRGAGPGVACHKGEIGLAPESAESATGTCTRTRHAGPSARSRERSASSMATA
jgi:hypothetical protein